MEIETLDSLVPNPKNPRKISEHDFNTLKESLKRFGELSGLVMNRRSNHLVGGHMRLQAFKQAPGEKKVFITQRFDIPNEVGTVAIGYVSVGNELYSYRVVDWDQATEEAALVSANHTGGEDDKELLGEIIYDLSQQDNADELLALTGLDDKEMEKLLADVGVSPAGDEEPDQLGPDSHDSDKLEFRLTIEQRECVEEALGYITSHYDMPSESNGSRNGSALYYMARDFLDRLHGLTDEGMVQNEQLPQAPNELTDIPA